MPGVPVAGTVVRARTAQNYGLLRAGRPICFKVSRRNALTLLPPFGEMPSGWGRNLMKLWSRGRDQLVEQTLAFVQGAERPVAPISNESAKQAIPSIPNEPKSTMDLERAEFAKHIANFRTHQERFRLERDQFCTSVMKATRAALEQHRVD